MIILKLILIQKIKIKVNFQNINYFFKCCLKKHYAFKNLNHLGHF